MEHYSVGGHSGLSGSVDQPGKCTGCLKCTKKVSYFFMSHIGLISIVVGYCIMGAFVFEELEKYNEIQTKKNMKTSRLAMSDTIWDITREMDVLHQENWTSHVTEKLKDFEKSLIIALKEKGWDGSEDTEQVKWSFTGALFYSITVITTIGYGNITPKTAAGKIVTIVYAILGIPITVICWSNIGDSMAYAFRFTYWKLCCYVYTKKTKKRRRRMIRRQKELSMSPIRQPPSLAGQLAPGQIPPGQGRRRSVRSRTSRVSTVSRPHDKMLLYPGDKRPANLSIEASATNYAAIQAANHPAIQASNYPIIQAANNPAIQAANNPAIQAANNPVIQTTNNNGVANYSGAVNSASNAAANTDPVRNGTDKPLVSVSLDTRSTVISSDSRIIISEQLGPLQTIDPATAFADGCPNSYEQTQNKNDRKLATVTAGETIEAVNGIISPEGKFRVVVEHLIQGDPQSTMDKKQPEENLPNEKPATTSKKPPVEKMRHVSEIVLSKLRTSKKSGNLSIDFDPKKLEYPANKTELDSPTTPPPLAPAVIISQDGKPSGLTRAKTILRSERGGSGSGKSQGSAGSQNQVPPPPPVARGQRFYRPGEVAGGVGGDGQDDMSFYEEIYYLDDEDEPEVDDVGKRPVPIILSTLLVVVYIIGGAFLFQKWEGWSLLDSSYFCFITLTTIGFGDFVPDHKHADDGEERLVLCSIYMLFGIAMLAMSFNLVQEEVISSVKTIGRMLGILEDDEDEEDY